MGLATLLAACLLGLLPGWGLATAARSPARPCAAFLLSLLVLFEGVLLLQLANVPIRFATVGVYELLTAAVALAVAARRRGWRALLPHTSGMREAVADVLGAPHGRILAACVAVVGVVFAVRYVIQPLSGVDTSWRWDFLARQLLATEALDFYPPRTAEHFRMFFTPDAIPPLVSIAYWWLYASYGRAVPELTAIVVIAQYACAMGLAVRLATQLHSRRAGMLAAAILASSPLFYRATFIGQETGLTTAALAAVLLFAGAWPEGGRWRAPLLAGAAAGLGALAREYAWAWTAVGVLTLAWRRAGVLPVLALAATALAVAGPWYLRTWLLTGNPVYPLAVGPFDAFALVPLYAGTQAFLRERLTRLPSANDLATYAVFVWSVAPIAIPVGVAALVARLRRDWALVAAVAIAAALWLQSIPYTQAGFRHASRVLAPAALVLSVAAATAIARGSARWLRVATGAVCLATLWTLRNAAVYPSELDEVEWRDVPKVATSRTTYVFQVREKRLVAELQRLLPVGSRILSDDNYAYVASQGTGYEIVPFWSPEFAFLVDLRTSAEDADRRLRAGGVRALHMNVRSVVTEFYTHHPFFTATTLPWKAVVELDSGYALFTAWGAAP